MLVRPRNGTEPPGARESGRARAEGASPTLRRARARADLAGNPHAAPGPSVPPGEPVCTVDMMMVKRKANAL